MKVKEHLEYISRIDLLEEDLNATKEELFEALDELAILREEKELDERYSLNECYEKINIIDFVYWLRFADRNGKSEELLNALEHYNLKK